MNIIEIYSVANDSHNLFWYFFLTFIFLGILIHGMLKPKFNDLNEGYTNINTPWKPQNFYYLGPREQIMIACIGLILVVFTFFYTKDKKSILVYNLNEGNYQTVEGKIENFNNDFTNKYIESFTISGIDFEYHKYFGYGYNRTMQEGGVLKPDMHVRIDYYGNVILRIYEIKNTK